MVLSFTMTATFGRRGIPPRGVARWSNAPGILPPRAFRSGRLNARVRPQLGKAVFSPQISGDISDQTQRRAVAQALRAVHPAVPRYPQGRVPAPRLLRPCALPSPLSGGASMKVAYFFVSPRAASYRLAQMILGTACLNPSKFAASGSCPTQMHSHCSGRSSRVRWSVAG